MAARVWPIVVFVASAGAVSAQTQNGPACAIDGTVVNAVTGEPLPRARIFLMASQGRYSTAADNAGRWSFPSVACGTTQVTATRPGFLPPSAGLPRGAMMLRPITLSPGAPEHGVRVELTPQTVIAGKVVDDQGDPVMNAQITALVSRVLEGRRSFQPTGSTSTNDLGEYRLPGLSPGKYIVCAHINPNMNGPDPSGDALVLADNCYPGPVEGGSSSAIEMAGGRETRADFNLQRVPAVHVRGVVAGLPKGQGVGVQLAKRGVQANFGGQPANVSPDGKFDVRGVIPGAYSLNTDYWEEGRRITARLPVDVGSSDVDGVVLRLEPGFTITGTLRIESTTGSAPPNQQLGFNLRSSESMATAGQVRWNAEHTAFSIADVVPGNYRLDAFPQGPYYLKSATLAGRDISREETRLSQNAGPLEIVIGDGGGSLEGQVTDANDQPLASSIMLLQDGRPPRIVMTPDGHFKTQNLAPGDYSVTAWDDVQQVEYADPEWMQRHAKSATVTVLSGQTVQVKLAQQLTQ